MSAEALKSAYEALAVGDVEPLVSLMSEDMMWRGQRSGWRFWQPVPS
jgi:ketosteroid isomerase-like protein